MYHKTSLLPLLLIAGCASPIETRINSAGEKDPALSAFVLGTEPRSEEGKAAQESVLAKLSERGLKANDAAPLRLDVTFSSLPASLKLVGSQGLGKAKPKRKSKTCNSVEHKLGIALARISDGAVVYRSVALEYHCAGNALAVIPVLADAAVKDIGAPKGPYFVERKPLP
jgi:hypothetical protein